MKYLALIYSREADNPTRSPAEMKAEMAAYFAFNKHAQDTGAFLAGEALLPTTAATTVSVRDGETLITDGPFAETTEQLGGFYMLECSNLDEAIALAAKIPTAARGRVEVRPIMQLPPKA